jgi:hypothetical protein
VNIPPGDGRKLPVVAGQDQPGHAALRLLEQLRHDAVIHHGRLVHHHHRLGVPACGVPLNLPQLAVQRGSMGVTILPQIGDNSIRRGQPDHTITTLL